jgi:hypothetical protein
MENYNLKQEMLLHEIYDRIHDQLTGFGYTLRPNVQYNKIYFGEGVELTLAAKGGKAEFQWSRSVIKMLEGNIRSMIGSLIFAILYTIVGYLSGWVWGNTLFAAVYIIMLIISVGILIVNIPIAIINSNTHAMKTQLLIRNIIEEYRCS